MSVIGRPLFLLSYTGVVGNHRIELCTPCASSRRSTSELISMAASHGIEPRSESSKLSVLPVDDKAMAAHPSFDLGTMD